IDIADKNIKITGHKYFRNGEDLFFSDEDKIHQIYSKVLDNALKFTKAGFVEFGYTYNEQQEYIEFYVKDTGIGVPEDLKSSIFKRFRQGDYGMNRKFEGLGLGLSIAEGLVNQLGGNIEVDSQVNKGTTVTFKLPYQGSQELLPNEEETILTKDISGKKILVAEDDIMNFLLVKELLINKDAEIIHAENGDEAVDLCKELGEIGLILMDIKMPVMDGIEALTKIREINPEIPAIALTAYAHKIDEKRLLDKGFNEYISKPIDKKAMMKLLKKYISIS
ncbi:MAG TPA: ATP-binding protein, partial [bacterium]|nr:ATP-binding protein [bacterium]